MAKTAKVEEKALIKWSEELAKYAEESVRTVAGIGGGKFVSIKDGTLTVDGSAIPGSRLACVVLDFVLENCFFSGAYDEDNPQPPICYAFGRAQDEMGPHDAAPEPQCEGNCETCKHNEWGTATKPNGAAAKGKACKNKIRLGLICAGTFDKAGDFQALDASAIKAATVYYLEVPPTSIKDFAGYAKSCKDTLLRPTWAMFTEISCTGSNKGPLKFAPINEVEDEDILPILKDRHLEVAKAIEFPYPKPEARGDKEAQASKGKARKGGKF